MFKPTTIRLSYAELSLLLQSLDTELDYYNVADYQVAEHLAEVEALRKRVRDAMERREHEAGDF